MEKAIVLEAFLSPLFNQLGEKAVYLDSVEDLLKINNLYISVEARSDRSFSRSSLRFQISKEGKK